MICSDCFERLCFLNMSNDVYYDRIFSSVKLELSELLSNLEPSDELPF